MMPGVRAGRGSGGAEHGLWAVDVYEPAPGQSPVRAFIAGLTGRDRVDGVALIKLLEERGTQLRRPRSAALGGGLFELRGTQVRLFYMFRPGRRATLLDGLIKKQDRIPADVLRRVRRIHKTLAAMDAQTPPPRRRR
jgi:hypothetical protein